MRKASGLEVVRRRDYQVGTYFSLFATTQWRPRPDRPFGYTCSVETLTEKVPIHPLISSILLGCECVPVIELDNERARVMDNNTTDQDDLKEVYLENIIPSNRL